MTDKTDQELIDAIQRGDQDAMECIYNRYKSWIYSLAFKCCNNHEDALEITQDVFRYFFKKFPGFELSCRFTTYIYPIVRNKSIDLIRIRKTTENLDSMDESKYAANDSRSFENIGELVSELSEDYREVLLMRFISGHSLNEIITFFYKTVNLLAFPYA